MKYRVANINDLDRLAQLHAESWRASYRGIFPDKYLDNDVWDERKKYWANRLCSPKHNQCVFIAINNNEIVGFICAFGNESDKWGTFIDNLHVATTTQGKGIGKQLMYLVAQWADDSFDNKGVYLEVLEDNLKARKFYHSIGARHQETNLWQPPGGNKSVNDLLYVWDNTQSLFKIND